MEAIVLAGGLGTRLRPVVADLPKPMAPVAGRPFLEILLDSLLAKGFTRVVLSLGYRSELVIGHFGDHYRGLALSYAVEEQPLGTGGALRLALSRCVADHAFVFNGDTYLDLEVDQVAAQWRRQQLPIIVARQVADTARYGRLSVADGRVTGFDSGVAGAGLINAGCYVFPVSLLGDPRLPERFSLETEFLAAAVRRLPFQAFITAGAFIDIGVPEDYLRAQLELKDIASA